jgi:hypothetical protein
MSIGALAGDDAAAAMEGSALADPSTLTPTSSWWAFVIL